MSEKKLYLSILTLLTLAIFIAVFAFVPRIPQWSSYHQFSDVRKIAGIPNFANVVSNMFFVLVSIFGFLSLWRQWQNKNLAGKEAIVFLTLFIGVFMTGFGSAYYHWSPDNDSLVWDRLPMTIVFMSLLSLTIMERVDFKLGFWLLIPLVLLGIFSVLYWHWTELTGRGDLRLYGIAQFYTIFLIIAILYLFPKSYPPLKIYLGMFIFYGLAKLFENFDLTIYRMGGLVSGHTLKHIFAAISTYGAVIMLNKINTR
jgi:Ceramidase